jgi:hypothetical protein
MPEDRKYVRVYYNDLIRDYPDVWYDDADLAAFVRLLSTADPMWPTPPELPRTVKARALDALKKAGLVIEYPRHRFGIKGLDAERSKRSDAASNAARNRWGNAERNATRTAEPMPTKDEPSKPEQTRAEPNARTGNDPWDAPEQEALVWLSRHGCDVRPGNGYHQKLITAVERHGINAVVGSLDRMAQAGVPNGDVKGLLFGAIDMLDKQARPSLVALEKEDRAADDRAARQRRIEATQVRLHETGGHELEPSAVCPRCKEATA